MRYLIGLILTGGLVAATWGTWNGKTVGGSTGNVSSLNGKTIGTATGNYNAWNGLLSPGGGGSNVTFVRSTAGAWSNTCVLGASVTSGDTVIGAVSFGANNTATLSSVTDDKANSYTLLTAKTTTATTNYTNGMYAQLFYSTNITNSPSTLTLTWVSGLQPSTLWTFPCLEISSSIIDGAVKNTTGTSTTPSAGTMTPAGAGEFGVSVAVIDDGNGGGLTAGSGWTTITAVSGGSESNGSEYQHIVGSSAVTGDFTNGGRSGTWVASGALFK